MKTLFRALLLSLVSLSAIAQPTESTIGSAAAPTRDGRGTTAVNSDGSIITKWRIGGVTSTSTIIAGGISKVNNISAVAGNVTLTSDNLTEGSTNLYSTPTRIRSAISGAGLINYTPGTGGITTNAITGDGAIAAGATTLTLATVNGAPGTFGSATAVAIPTVNAKGLVTGVTTSPITPAGIGAALAATTLLYDRVATYDGASNSVTAYPTPAANSAVMIKVTSDENGAGTDYASDQIYLKVGSGSIFKFILERKN